MWDWEGTVERKIKFPSTFLAASQFSSLIAMGAPRRTTLSTSSAANKQKKHLIINNKGNIKDKVVNKIKRSPRKEKKIIYHIKDKK